MKTLLFSWLLGLAVVGAHAQQGAATNLSAGKKPLPQGTLLHLRAPESARWIITENPSKPTEQGKLPFKRRVVVTKTPTVIHEQIVNQEGKRDKWCFGTIQYTYSPQRKQFLSYDKNSFRVIPMNPDLYTDYSVTDFPGFEWVSPKYFSDVRVVMNRECIVFDHPGKDGEKAAVACVDLATRLPFVLQEGDAVRLYEFQRGPQQIQIPEQLRQILSDKAKAAAQAQVSSPSR